ncbi:LAGLIDADG family homing endonuclease [Rossellomorea aquimaris]|uniref:LAGLIDADG family homing endonuclease n=1 Tax=Rossellomorea aquimaris TaxID=189382 RepID=UPI001CD5F45E|nr:LAGLIDADG family homing endonuclease [Rossellomorea aquimaris]MCA1055417.1 LAGLIDADG family homing endonuclease [Rossellomorea aquimaris]
MKEWEAAYLAGIVDGEGSITLTRMHENEHRRPCISVASTDRELLEYLQDLTNGHISKKKNYNPTRHLNSYSFTIKNKTDVLSILKEITPYLRVEKKKKRATWILKYYDKVTKRNGKYSAECLKRKLEFEEDFFSL